MEMATGIGVTVFFMIYGIILLGFLGIWVFVMVLFIKLAFRGIKALDFYNEKAAIELAKLKETQNEIIEQTVYDIKS
jgi:hypothetical protein